MSEREERKNDQRWRSSKKWMEDWRRSKSVSVSIYLIPSFSFSCSFHSLVFLLSLFPSLPCLSSSSSTSLVYSSIDYVCLCFLERKSEEEKRKEWRVKSHENRRMGQAKEGWYECENGMEMGMGLDGIRYNEEKRIMEWWCDEDDGMEWSIYSIQSWSSHSLQSFISWDSSSSSQSRNLSSCIYQC